MSVEQILPYLIFVWLVTAAYLGAMFLAGRRLKQLAESGRAPDAADELAPAQGSGLTFPKLRFIFSGRHNRFDDPQLSRLTLTARLLFVLDLPLMLALFATALTHLA